MDKHTIIKMKIEGVSNRSISKLTGINRKTVSKYWNEYQKLSNGLNSSDNVEEIQEKITSEPKYDSSNRKERKYNEQIDKRLNEILKHEEEKTIELGRFHKQKLTRAQIFEILRSEKFDIGYSTISNKIREKLNKSKETFIKQDYEYGDRLEYDFGEVRLLINGVLRKYYLAVMSSPASDFKWAYLYKNQKKDVFLDSHVKFFEMMGGIYKEVVYDNMRNVVTKFIGRNEKQLDEDLIKMSMYYGYQINVTNCYKGNEKGHVEGSVKKIRNNIFAVKYEFNSFEEAQEYINTKLIKLNEKSNYEEEKTQLLPYKPILELADITDKKVDKYSFVRINNNFYSVPDYLVGKNITVKIYFDKIKIYSNNIFVCEHKKVDGKGNLSIEIKHYLKTLLKKPGAIKNSLALKSSPELKSIYDKHFTSNPKKFIELILENKDKSKEELLKMFNKYISKSVNVIPISTLNSENNINNSTKNQLIRYSKLMKKGVHNYAN